MSGERHNNFGPGPRRPGRAGAAPSRRCRPPRRYRSTDSRSKHRWGASFPIPSASTTSTAMSRSGRPTSSSTAPTARWRRGPATAFATSRATGYPGFATPSVEATTRSRRSMPDPPLAVGPWPRSAGNSPAFGPRVASGTDAAQPEQTRMAVGDRDRDGVPRPFDGRERPAVQVSAR